MRRVRLRLLGQPLRLLDAPDDLGAALESANRSPYPPLVLVDELGRLLRFEAGPDGGLLDRRDVGGGGVRWSAIGRGARNPGATAVPIALAGRIRKAREAERLDAAAAGAVLDAFCETGSLPAGFTERPVDGEDGSLCVLAGQDREPRPVGGWPEVARYLSGLPAASPCAFALSRPDRALVGVLGDGARFVVQVRETRGALEAEGPLRREEADPTPTPLGLGTQTPARRADELLDRDELPGALASLYRFEVPPPGLLWGPGTAT